MVLKNAIAAALCTGLLMSGSAALAGEYRAGEFLGLDLSQARLRGQKWLTVLRRDEDADRKSVV